MARVFSAIDVESKKLVEELGKVQDRIDLGFSPVKKDKMHITLEFFQDIGKKEIDELKATMDKVEADSFTAEVSGVGCFPSTEHIRVVWSGLDQEEKFQRLYSQLSDHKIASDNKHEFKPHITLMRVRDIDRDEKKKLRRTLREFKNHRFGELEVKKVKLFRSDLQQGDSRYEELYSREL